MNRQVFSGELFGNWILIGEPFRNVRGLVWRAQCRTDAAHTTIIPHRDIANDVTALIPLCAECTKADEQKHQEDLQRHREHKRSLAAWRPAVNTANEAHELALQSVATLVQEHFDDLRAQRILEDSQ
jgi:hypothetical protein